MLTYLILTAGLSLAQADVKTEAPFTVSELPVEPPIEGLLGEPGAPNLKDQQERLSQELLKKGICNVAYFGEDFCTKRQAGRFKVHQEKETPLPDAEAMGQTR